MSKVEDSLEMNLQSLSNIRENTEEINDFLVKFDLYNSELNTVNFALENINDELKHYDFIDYINSKKSYDIVSLDIVNKLIQQIKISKNEITDTEYLNKAEIVYKFLIKEGYKFIKNVLDKSVDILYMNDDFINFTNLIDTDKEIKQIILWHRSQECIKKREYYKGDLNIFYRMMIKQECFIWYKLFYKDFIFTINSLQNNESFTFYEKFLYSVLLPYFEEEEFIEVKNKKINIFIKEFSTSCEVQDYVYDLILQKCYNEYSGYKKRTFEI